MSTTTRLKAALAATLALVCLAFVAAALYSTRGEADGAAATEAAPESARAGAAHDGHHGHPDDQIGYVEHDGDELWMAYDYDPTIPEALADNSRDVFFAEVLAVGPEAELPQPPGDTFGEPQPKVHDLRVRLTEAPVSGSLSNGEEAAVSRKVIEGVPAPQVGERWMFFTKPTSYDAATDTSQGPHIVQVQPYGEKAAPDQATRDQLYATYYGPANNNVTYSQPEGFYDNGNEPPAEYCTQDAPDTCETGRLPY